MQITEELVTHLEDLSKLEFTEKDKVKFIDDFSQILEHFEILSKVDTTNIELQKNHKNAEHELREDKELKGLELKDILKNAPQNIGASILVPTVVEE